MRLYFLSGLLCILLLQCRANPIITINADQDALEQKQVEIKGEMQEETTGVFKNEVNESNETSDNKQTDIKDDSKIVENNQQEVSVSTESNEIPSPDAEKNSNTDVSIKPKPKRGKVIIFSIIS